MSIILNITHTHTSLSTILCHTTYQHCELFPQSIPTTVYHFCHIVTQFLRPPFPFLFYIFQHPTLTEIPVPDNAIINFSTSPYLSLLFLHNISNFLNPHHHRLRHHHHHLLHHQPNHPFHYRYFLHTLTNRRHL